VAWSSTSTYPGALSLDAQTNLAHTLCRVLDIDRKPPTMARNILPFHKRDTVDTPPSRNHSTTSNGFGETPSTSRKSGDKQHHHHHPHFPHHDHPHRKNAMSKYVNNFWRNEIVAALSEFAGTFMFLCKLMLMADLSLKNAPIALQFVSLHSFLHHSYLTTSVDKDAHSHHVHISVPFSQHRAM
jgi:hypothetical protein